MVTVPTPSGGALSCVRLRSNSSSVKGGTEAARFEANQSGGANSRQRVMTTNVLGLVSHCRRHRTRNVPVSRSMIANASNCVAKLLEGVNDEGAARDVLGPMFVILQTPCSFDEAVGVGLLWWNGTPVARK